MSGLVLTQEEEAHLDDTRQPALWGCLIVFLVINNLAIAGRLWGTWTSVASRSRVMAEDVLIILSGIFVNAIIANLMVATHYGLGLHVFAINFLDAEYPTKLSKTFRPADFISRGKHIWITMVLMGSFFTSIKMTLLFFYRRLFLVANKKLHIFWWVNFVYVVLWFFGATSFYLFQCKPVQWYFIQYFSRYHKPVPGNITGNCDATSVLHVALPAIFSLVSDIGLLLLPIWAISQLRLNKNKKRGLMVIFGIGLIACFLELARVLVLLLDTDDKTDPSYGVAVFLILTAAEETTAVVCASLPVIVPQLVRRFKGKVRGSSYVYDKNAAQASSERRSARGFKRVASLNHIWTMPTTIDASKVDNSHEDGIPLTTIEITGNSTTKDNRHGGASNHLQLQPPNHIVNIESQTRDSYLSTHLPDRSQISQAVNLDSSASSDIYVRTDIQIRVGDASEILEDAKNPYGIATGMKWWIIIILALGTLSVSLSSSVFSGSLPQIESDFGVGSELVILSVSLFVLGFAIGPMAELYDRPNIQTLLVLRFFADAFGSSSIVNSGGVVFDIFVARKRGLAVMVYIIAPFLGPTLGPICTGFLAQSGGWKWVDSHI
ncbi:hypothetical protein GL218_00183 [Daldinia childiae]|uniref:uncharacterized protein n=1 Tax=Daldinia childiae TaxID=326645 RepID=UPI0014470A7A|nr:uncharacterized protein GL218_00183 [Daldinia childiae]KAF3070850.1 hypothetical protein GL218_00183 [Daldinia childiae]